MHGEEGALDLHLKTLAQLKAHFQDRQALLASSSVDVESERAAKAMFTTLKSLRPSGLVPVAAASSQVVHAPNGHGLHAGMFRGSLNFVAPLMSTQTSVVPAPAAQASVAAPWTTTAEPTVAPKIVNTGRKGVDGRAQCHGCGAMYSGPNGQKHTKSRKVSRNVRSPVLCASKRRVSTHHGCRRDRRATGRGSRRARGANAASSFIPSCSPRAPAAKANPLGWLSNL